MVGSYYREDLLERVMQAPDTSLERWRRSTGQGSTADISIAAQARTVRINPKYRGKLKGKTVVVFDDFTTEGKSIEWARILLSKAGTAQVITLTVGKYGSRHTNYGIRPITSNDPGIAIDPYTVSNLSATDFVSAVFSGTYGPGPQDSLTTTMAHFAAATRNTD
ncbi:phosphoribosyltransferase [Streptomyces tauricus]|uniref:phosphoribosyltransferase n=1 Tax=Streptomyces tauricus TaxID=68274 RepID=UPI003823BC50